MDLYGKKYAKTDFPNQLVVDDLLRTQIKAAGIAAPFVKSEVVDAGADIILWFGGILTSMDVGQLNIVVSLHQASVEVAKQLKFAAIDARTDLIIERGFQYSGKQFSCSLEAQSRALGMDVLRTDELFLATLPIMWNTMDNNDAVSLTTAEEIHAFFLTGVAYYQGAINSGSALKAQVRAATTIDEVNAVVDARP